MKTTNLRLLPLCLALALAISLTGCVVINPINTQNTVTGSGSIVTEQYQVPAYTEVELNVSLDLVYSADPQSYVELETYENLVEHIQIRVVGETLIIESDAEIYGDKASTLTISPPSLTKIAIRGMSTVTAEDTIVADAFRLSISGAADVKLDLQVAELDAVSSGASVMKLTGTADSAKIQVSGAGDITAKDLVTNRAQLILSGAGEISIHCTDELDVRLSGASSVSYRGNPKISQQISGAGSIQHIA